MHTFVLFTLILGIIDIFSICPVDAIHAWFHGFIHASVSGVQQLVKHLILENKFDGVINR